MLHGRRHRPSRIPSEQLLIPEGARPQLPFFCKRKAETSEPGSENLELAHMNPRTKIKARSSTKDPLLGGSQLPDFPPPTEPSNASNWLRGSRQAGLTLGSRACSGSGASLLKREEDVSVRPGPKGSHGHLLGCGSKIGAQNGLPW